MKQLVVPTKALDDPQAVEMARVWQIDGKQHLSLNAPGWKDPTAWGLLIADIARTAADSYVTMYGLDREDVRSRIKATFDDEWNHPTNVFLGDL